MKRVLLTLIAAGLTLPAFATPGSTAQQEIDHLLDFISSSNCTFIRNGTEYPASKARSHIEGKYDYIRRWINSSEQFITYAATKSSLSGDRYLVHCEGQLINSVNWLQQELQRYKSKLPTKSE